MNPNLPGGGATGDDTGMAKAGSLTVDLSGSAASLHAGHDVEPNQREPVPDGQTEEVTAHDVEMFLVQMNLRASYFITDRWLAEIAFPMGVARQRARFLDASSESVDGFDSIHHRNETVAGLGDVQLLAGMWLSPDGASWAARVRLGATLPTGGTEPDPFALGERRETHQHVFFGSGTVDPLVGVEFMWNAAPIHVALRAQGRMSLYANEHGYRKGANANAGLAISYVADTWQVGLEPGLHIETPSEWPSRAAVNSGRLDALASAIAAWMPDSSWGLQTKLTVPFTVRSEGGHFEIPWLVSLGMTYRR